MTKTDTTYASVNALTVYGLLQGNSNDVARAMVRAERSGKSYCQNATITHVGYESGAREFNAATALYRVTF